MVVKGKVLPTSLPLSLPFYHLCIFVFFFVNGCVMCYVSWSVGRRPDVDPTRLCVDCVVCGSYLFTCACVYVRLLPFIISVLLQVKEIKLHVAFSFFWPRSVGTGAFSCGLLYKI